MAKKGKTIMRAFKIDEISAVDNPAQEGARMVLMKRAPDEIEDEDLLEKGAVLTSDDLGHSHLIYCLDDSGGTTSYSRMSSEKGDDMGHSHPYVITMEGKIVIGEAEGHTHTAAVFGKDAPKKSEIGKQFGAGDYAYVPDPSEPSSWKLRLTKSPGGEPDSQLVDDAVETLGGSSKLGKSSIPSGDRSSVIARVSRAWLVTNKGKTRDELPDVLKTQTIKEKTMSKDQPTKEELQKALDDGAALKTQLEKANKIAALTDVEKSHYNSLADADKDAFLGKSVDERKAVVAKAAEGDPVVFKSAAGIEYRKSAGEQMIALAKQSDENAALAKSEKEKREANELQKRAEDEFKHLPGTVVEKAAMLKSLEAIPDEATRKAAIAAVKAGDKAISAGFTRKGAGGNTSTPGDSTGTSESTDQLDTLAKNYAKDNKVTFEKAYATVIKTAEGKALYEASLMH